MTTSVVMAIVGIGTSSTKILELDWAAISS